MKTAPIIAAIMAALPASYDPANEVDVELVLAVDISQSMESDEKDLQRAGYAAALLSREFLDAIEAGPLQRIAVSYVEWGGIGEQYVVADWQIIDGPDSAAHLAEEILTAPENKSQRTSIADALRFSKTMLENNQYQGLRSVIDISGDGPNNQGGAVTEARDMLVSAGITINGLPLKLKQDKTAWAATFNIVNYYRDCVIGGPGSFAEPVRSKDEFPQAVKRKLVTEVAGIQPQVIHASSTESKPTNCGMFD
ncbi:DUF1194 domain-containing protein [Roseibium algicola]|nr:DUF1194 domain-containing protein [Roseibium aggregatum]